MVITPQAQVARVQTLADGTIRATIDFPEFVTLGDFEALLRGNVKLILVEDKNSVPPLLIEALDKIIDAYGKA